ncbi:MAG: hypothetical protein ACE5JB_02520 [bacterium]
MTEFIDDLYNEFNKQIQSFFELKKLVESQKKLLESGEYCQFNKIINEKKRLLELINAHKKNLIDFQNSWFKFKHRFSTETEIKINGKIEELKGVVSDILYLEKQCHKIIKTARNKNLEELIQTCKKAEIKADLIGTKNNKVLGIK